MGRSEIRGGQIKDDSITGDDVDESTLIITTLQDADGDTKIQIEESADEDKIRFDTAGSERMIINEAGRVGIGTNDPDNTLHVQSLGTTHIKIASEAGYEAALKLKSGEESSAYVWQPGGTSDLRLYVGGADRVHVDANGNVGIGTPDPQTTLHVKGDPGQFRVEDTTVDYAYTIDCDGDGIRTHFGDMTGGGDEDSFMTFGAYTGINRLDTAARDFHIYGTNTTTGFYFDESAGKFGIGTTGPDRKLDVLDASNPQIRLTHTDGSKYVDLKATSGGDLEITPSNSNGHVKISSADNATMVIQSDDVGNGDAQIGFSIDAGSNVQWSLGCDDSDGDKFKVGTSLIETNTRLTIDSTGNVGIGTTSPLSLLHVNGDVDFQGGQKAKFRDVNTSDDIEIDDYVIRCINGAAMTLTLPAKNSASGQIVVIKDALGSANVNNITIDGDGSDTIDGAPSTLLDRSYGCFWLMCDGINGWMVLHVQ